MHSQHTPHVQWLRTFLSVSHCGSFSEAAQGLHLTQAAVSKHIRLLEHAYGVALFKRHGRGVSLTDAGRLLQPKIQQAFALLDQASEELYEDLGQQRVRVRCDATWAEAVIAPRLAEFCACHPEIELMLSTYIWADESTLHDASIALVFGHGEREGQESLRLIDECAVAVATPDLAERILRDEQHWAITPRLVLVGYEDMWQRWQSAKGLTSLGPKVIADSSITLKRAALAGQGIALQRQSLVQRELNDNSLVLLDDICVDYTESYYLQRPLNKPLNPAEQTVWHWLSRLKP